jgi:hypothetical protein
MDFEHCRTLDGQHEFRNSNAMAKIQQIIDEGKFG